MVLVVFLCLLRSREDVTSLSRAKELSGVLLRFRVPFCSEVASELELNPTVPHTFHTPFFSSPLMEDQTQVSRNASSVVDAGKVLEYACVGHYL